MVLTSFLFVLILSLASCGFYEPAPQVLKITGNTMGTTYSVTLIADADMSLQVQDELRTVIADELAKVNQEMSTYIGDSELMHLNVQPFGQWLQVSKPLLEILSLSLSIAENTGGAFDITVGPLVELWGFGASTSDDTVPPLEDIQARLKVTGYKKVEARSTPEGIYKHADIRLDLSAIAKGHGADRVSRVLDARGLEHYLVEIGGELKMKGFNARGEAWRIGIEAPSLEHGSTQKAISVLNKGVATSGDYRNFFEVDGKRYSHTIDPRTGWPVDHNLASVTVIADSAAEADAYATAFSVLGRDKAIALAESLELAAFFVVREQDGFIESYTSNFAPYLQ